MRVSRFVSAVVALLVAVALPMATLASPVHAAGKSAYQVTAAGKEVGNTNKFVAYGAVQDYKNKKVMLLEGKGKNGKYHGYKSAKTDRKGHFNIKFDGPVGNCYKLVVPGNKKHKTTSAFIGCLIRA